MTWICSGVSIAKVCESLEINKLTADRKIRWLAQQSRIHHERILKDMNLTSLTVQFDELETHEHTPLKPLSVAMAVNQETGFIFGFSVAEMPAKGLLAAQSVKKYGQREDLRSKACLGVLGLVAKSTLKTATVHIYSDAKKAYPALFTKAIPSCKLHQVKSEKHIRGMSTHDPLGAVNSLCSHLRADLAVLARKSMVTVKSSETLDNLLWIYLAHRNGYDICAPTNQRAL